ncbi:MAG: hypothetical protein MJZ68_04300 [archaeon]|nr:hypothetical protein [archaeon]
MATISFDITVRLETEEELRNLWLAYKDAEAGGGLIVTVPPEEVQARRIADYEYLKKASAKYGYPRN